MKGTKYKYQFEWSLFDLIPPEYDWTYEPPIVLKIQQDTSISFPGDWADIFKVRAFVVEDAEDLWVGNIIFWGGIHLHLIGIHTQTAIYIGWRK
jgi:hypothetical protein